MINILQNPTFGWTSCELVFRSETPIPDVSKAEQLHRSCCEGTQNHMLPVICLPVLVSCGFVVDMYITYGQFYIPCREDRIQSFLFAIYVFSLLQYTFLLFTKQIESFYSFWIWYVLWFFSNNKYLLIPKSIFIWS